MGPQVLACCKPCWHAGGLLGQAGVGDSLPADAQAEILPGAGLPLYLLADRRMVNHVITYYSGPTGMLATMPGSRGSFATSPLGPAGMLATTPEPRRLLASSPLFPEAC